MERKITFILILLLFGAMILLIVNMPKSITGKAINQQIFTKAICNETNYCEDYLIECEGKTIKRLTPTGLSIQHDKDWEDSREPKELCDF